MIEYGGVKLTWLGHDGFRIEGGGVEVVIDPFRLRMKGKRSANVLFVTHDHFDHCSPSDIEKVLNERETVVIAAKNCEQTLKRFKIKDLRSVSENDWGEAFNVKYRAVPAYNLNKFRSPGVPFHPREYGGLGFVIDIGGVRIYHAGDTDRIPEMKELGGIDVALLPVSGVYVMTAEEAAGSVEDIMPKLAIPMHYGSIVGSVDDAERFKRLAKCRVEILNVEE